MIVLTRDLRPGDRIVVDRLARPFTATVSSVEPTGRLVMGDDYRRMMAIRFSDGPTVVKWIETAEDAPQTLAGEDA